MALVYKREAAKRDLIAQWVWYAENASIEVADHFLATTESTAIMLAGQPEAGTRVFVTRSEIQGIRRFPVSEPFDTMLLFYFPLQNGIDLVRVVHGSRDLLRLLAEGFFG